MIKAIRVEVIPHDQQRYPTVGDWQLLDDGQLVVRVSDVGVWQQNMLIVIHEVVEAILCTDHGITDERIDEFDLDYKGEGEPGDDPKSPYALEHSFATAVERMCSAAMQQSWDDYEKRIIELCVS